MSTRVGLCVCVSICVTLCVSLPVSACSCMSINQHVPYHRPPPRFLFFFDDFFGDFGLWLVGRSFEFDFFASAAALVAARLLALACLDFLFASLPLLMLCVRSQSGSAGGIGFLLRSRDRLARFFGRTTSTSNVNCLLSCMVWSRRTNFLSTLSGDLCMSTILMFGCECSRCPL
jgi:hypothetical protein